MTWSQAFCAYLERHKIKAADAALVLGVRQSTVHYWTRGSEPRGEKGLALKRRVEVWTRGEVKAAPWTVPEASEPDDGNDRARRRAS
jgi:hypothetical protein